MPGMELRPAAAVLLSAAAFAAFAQAPLSPEGFPSPPGPRLENLDPWLDPLPLSIPADAPTRHDAAIALRAFWTDFLGDPPERLRPFADEIVSVLCDGCGEAAARDLLARAFPASGGDVFSYRASTLEDCQPENPLSLSLPWAYAYALLLRNAGRLHGEGGALTYWYCLGATGSDDSYAWRDFLAAAFSADKYLLATDGRTDNDARRNALRKLIAGHAAAGVAAYDPPPPASRILHDRLSSSRSFMRSGEDGALPPLCTELEARGITNAIACAFRSRAEKNLAWKERGGGWASAVTEEGWEGFRDHLARAVEYALRARELDPGWDVPYDLLLTPAGAGGYGAESMEDLLRGALARNADCFAAVDTYFHFIRPRWCNGGAPAALRALHGIVSLPRTDTYVPFRALEALRVLSEDQEEFPGAWAAAGHPLPLSSDPALWPAFREMFRRSLAEKDCPKTRPSLLAWFLLRARGFFDPASALAAYDEAGSPAMWEAEAEPWLHERLVLGPDGLDTMRAEAALDDAAPRARFDLFAARFLRDREKAAAALSRIRAAAGTAFPDPPDAAAARVLERAERDFAIDFDWEGGEGWKDVRNLANYRRRWGPRAAWYTGHEAGTLCAHVTNLAGKAYFEFPPRQTDDDDSGATAYSGIAADFRSLPPEGFSPARVMLLFRAGETCAAGIQFSPDHGGLAAFVSPPDDPDGQKFFATHWVEPPPGEARFRLRLEVEGGKLSAWYEGEKVFDALEIPGGEGEPFPAAVHPGVEIPWLPDGATVWIERLRLREAP